MVQIGQSATVVAPIAPTGGTWGAVAANLGVTLLGFAQSMDWVHLLGNSSTAGYITMGLGVANMLAHAFTGNAPVVGKPTQGAAVTTARTD